MKTSIKFFKAANYVLILTGALHLVGHFLKQPENEQEKAMLDLLYNCVAFNFLGYGRTMGDIFDSLSLSLSAFSFFIAFFNLMLEKNVNEKTLSKVISYNFILWLVIAIIMIMYAFTPPIACYVTVWLLMMISLLVFRKQKKEIA